MVVAFDLFRENGAATVYAEGMPQSGFTFPCFPPCYKGGLADAAEEKLFITYLTKLLFFLKTEYKEEV